MSPATSSFLDILRITAAMTVFINHCAQFWWPRVFAITAPLAHSAVVVFFVLSGYVIAYSTFDRDRNAKRFVVARLSRLYSVVLPALLLTFLLQTIGNFLNPQFYAEHSRGFDALRYLLTGCFLQNVWFLNASPPTNVPFWSLSYEFWYYALFAVAVFVRGSTVKVCILVAISFLIGPNILLLLPCWVLGVALFVWRSRLMAIIPLPRVALPLSVIAMILVIAFLPPYPSDLANRSFLCSGAFLTDWIIALTVGLSIISFDALQLSPFPPVAAGSIRYCADHTFSLYLYHFPLIAFATATISFGRTASWQVAGVAFAILGMILLLSSITEAKRSKWRTGFAWGYDRLASKAS